MTKKLLISAGLLGAIALTASAFVRQQVDDQPLHWKQDVVEFTVQADGDPRISDGSDHTAVRLAFRAWERPDARVRFREVTDPAQRARRDWRSDDVHLVTWDTDNESGLFGSGTGLVAATPLDFDPTTGELLDADVVLNGSRVFSTTLESGTFDLQSVVTHEVGHFLGLDHSAVEGATMNPRTAAGETWQRSLEKDDHAALAASYPVQAGAYAALAGVVRRENGRPVSAAHVVAEDARGEPVSATITDGQGRYRLEGLPSGSYVVYAQPLDGAVRPEHFQLGIRKQTADQDFGTTFWGASGRSDPASPETVTVSAGALVDLGELRALPATRLRAQTLSSERVAPGATIRLSVYGGRLGRVDGVVIPAAGSDLLVDGVDSSSGAVRFDLTVAPGAAFGLRSIRLFRRDTWEAVVVTGRLEVRAPAPTISGLSATRGLPGDALELRGEHFQSGARVFLGREVTTTHGLGTRLTLTIPPLPDGTYDLVLENPDGQLTVARDAVTVDGSTVPALTAGSAPDPVFSGGGGSGGSCSLAPGETRPGSAATALLFLLILLGLAAARRSYTGDPEGYGLTSA